MRRTHTWQCGAEARGYADAILALADRGVALSSADLDLGSRAIARSCSCGCSDCAAAWALRRSGARVRVLGEGVDLGEATVEVEPDSFAVVLAFVDGRRLVADREGCVVGAPLRAVDLEEVPPWPKS